MSANRMFLLLLGIALGMGACRNDSVPRPTYALRVQQGTGGGTYEVGTVVTVGAEAPRAGLAFVAWRGDAVFLNDSLAVQTELLMPEQDVLLTAVFLDTQQYALEVLGGHGSGAYLGGTRVRVIADPPAEGQQFGYWQGDSSLLDRGQSDSTWFTMPYRDARLIAVYEDLPRYPLMVAFGTGSGEYLAGTTVSIEAGAAPTGQRFAAWTGDTALLADPFAAATTLVMPAQAVNLTANYELLPDLSLTVVHGQGSGTYPYGTVVTVIADAAPAGEQFIRWGGAIGALQNFAQPQTQLTLTANDTIIARFRADSIARFSYAYDVVPLFQLHCEECHYPGANYSDLTDYQIVKAYKNDIRSFLQTGYMPPNGGMTDEEIQVIIGWINRGANQN